MAQTKPRTAKASQPAAKRSAAPKRSTSAKRSAAPARSTSASRSPAPKRSASSSKSRNGSGSKTRAAAARRTSASRSSSSSRSNGAVDDVRQAVTSGAQSTKDTVVNGAKTAGDALGTVAQKSVGPALAGGAALAGLAGGLAIAGRSGPKRVLGVPVPGTRRSLVKLTIPRRAVTKDLLKAAGQVGSAGRQVGELATEVRLVRENMQSPRRRSPVEVVLDSLTARKPRRY
jgi:hypothetical protein